MSNSETIHQLATIRDYIRFAVSTFERSGLYFGHGTSTALDEAVALVLLTLDLPLDLDQDYFSSHLTLDERGRVLELIDLRAKNRTPLSYLTHAAFFAGYRFYVDERVLVPRSPIAELIDSLYAPWVDPDQIERILDLCTGSGCIAIASAHAFPDAEVDAVDLSNGALDVAAINVASHGLEGRVNLMQSDLFSALAGRRYDLIVSNPPYVSTEEWNDLPLEYHAEPRLGLESGVDGLDCVRRILSEAADHLTDDGVLIVEVGNSADALEWAYPEVPFTWIDFSHGGDGVFCMTYQQLRQYFS